MKKIILAITGASGSLYAIEFLKLAAAAGVEVHALISDAGRKVLHHELGMEAEALSGVAQWHDVHDFTAAMASGSARFDAMLVVPCTMGTLAAIAHGLSVNLIHRAADVMLKERRPVVLAVRETPLSRTHLANMMAAHEAGAVICPAMPAFYNKPTDLTEMARGFAGRLCDLVGIAVTGVKRWGEEA